MTTFPRVSIRSLASRVCSIAAGGSGLTIMIQPASGPGVQERARCRICLNPSVVIRPTFAPLPSSTALVATVVPCMMWVIAAGDTPARRQTLSMPASTPTEGSAGVEGTLVRTWRPVSSSKSKRSVKVPPTSTPSLRGMMPSFSCFFGASAPRRGNYMGLGRQASTSYLYLGASPAGAGLPTNPLCLAGTLPQKFNQAGKNRDENNGEDDQSKVLFHNRDIAEGIAGEHTTRNPGHASYDVVTGEPPIGHTPN